MKKYIYILVFAMTISSCEKEFLDVVPDNIATLEDAFSNRNSAEKFLASCYTYLPNAGNKSSDPGMISGDDIVKPAAYDNLGGVKIAKGYQNTGSPSFDYWGKGTGSSISLYKGITNCNILIANIGTVRDMDDSEQRRWIAEAKFLKAYYHFYLINMYGPVIINDKLPSVGADISEIAPERSTIDECFTYVIDLMEEAIPDLSPELFIEEYGKVTKAIAASIRARALVTYASPMFNGNKIYTDFLNSEGKPFFPLTYDPIKWERAAEGCQIAIDACHEVGLSLYDGIYESKKTEDDFTLLKAGLRGRVTDPWNSEIIWGNAEADSNTIQRESHHRLVFVPEKNLVLSNHSATLRMAELYYSNNGVPIEEDVSWDFENRYKLKTSKAEDALFVAQGEVTAKLHFDREPRFYSDVSFDRSLWFGNGLDDTYVIEARKGETASRRNKNIVSMSGYQPKKLVNVKTSINFVSARFTQVRYSFPRMRLSDLYLLHAEALNEVGGPSATVYQYVDLIRSRAGIDGVVNSWKNHSRNPLKPSTQEGLRDIIRKERLIELAFEGRRFWDLRRWLLAKDLMNKPIKGWNVDGESITGEAEVFYQLTLLNSDKVSNFEERDYLWPIPLSEIINVPGLQQNPGW